MGKREILSQFLQGVLLALPRQIPLGGNYVHIWVHQIKSLGFDSNDDKSFEGSWLF